MDATLDISVVVPLYNEEESLPELVEWIDRVARGEGLSYEVILVDDGSGDGSWRVIESLHERFAAVRGIKFARNYGKSAALYCGFAEARGEVVFTMDADLQDSPDWTRANLAISGLAAALRSSTARPTIPTWWPVWKSWRTRTKYRSSMKPPDAAPERIRTVSKIGRAHV